MSYGRAVADPEYASPEWRARLEADPNHIMIRLNGYEIDNSDPRPHWESNPVGSDAEVIEAPRVAVVGAAQPPDYMEADHGRKARAEAVAEAVKHAILDGTLDPSAFE